MYRFFYDLAVYRCSRAEYDAWYKAAEGKYIREALGDRTERGATIHLKETFFRRYGGWEFNETVGFIKLHFLGSQIRGAYFSSLKERAVLSRRKIFIMEELKLVPEMDIPHPASSKSILDVINNYLEECRRTLPRGFLIDTELFQEIAPHMDWLALYSKSK